jgi:hypothetical protein
MQILASLKASNVPITSSVAIGDVTHDGYLKIVYSNVSDVVQLVNTNIRTFKNKVVWPMYLGSAQRTGSLTYKDDPVPYLVMIGASIGACLLLLGAVLVIRMKNMNKRPKVVSL